MFWFLVCLESPDDNREIKTPLGGRIEVKSMDARSISAIWLVRWETRHVCLELTFVTWLWFHAICITDAADPNFPPQISHLLFHICHCVFFLVQIRPYVGCLVQYLPLLWKQSEEHNMLRCAILTTLIHLVQVRTDPCRRQNWDFPLNFHCVYLHLAFRNAPPIIVFFSFQGEQFALIVLLL